MQISTIGQRLRACLEASPEDFGSLKSIPMWLPVVCAKES